MRRDVDILPLTVIKDTILLMIAPPGWGKTTLILDLYRRSSSKIIFISPLRALAEEFYSRALEMKNVYRLNGDEDIQSFMNKDKAMLVTTAEKLDESLIELGLKENILYIFDEFHLFYYWGDTFRPLLLEKIMGCASSNCQILALTATMENNLLERWKAEFINSTKNCYILNIGNQVLMNKPRVINNLRYVNERAFNRSFLRDSMSLNLDSTILLFVKFRRDVDQWIDLCKRLKISCIGCVGGEITQFMQSLDECPKPRCIITTSALSHGVNLPIISKVYISYPVENKDFWVQMVGRGGRDGSEFEVYEVESWKWSGCPKKLFWNFYYSVLFILRDFFLTLYSGKL